MAPLLETPIAHFSSLPEPVAPAPQDDFASFTGAAPITPAEELPTVICSNHVVLPGRRCVPATIVISPSSGKIINVFSEILPKSRFPPGTRYTDYSPKCILPGLVDAHVHLNEPGARTAWEGFETGTRAAVSGGVTTLIDMPLNAIPPTTTIENFQKKLNAAQGQCWVDVGFYGGVIPGNDKDLVPLVKAGVRGFKCFLIESGVDEFPAVTDKDIAKAMEALKDTPTVLMFHAETLPPLSNLSAGDSAPSGPANKYKTFLDSRPADFETCAIEKILAQAHIAPDLRLHIVHLSAADGIPLVREAKKRGIKITAETCFHYLTLVSEEVKDGDTRYKCCPPIRETSNREHLWDALKEGVIETVVSDHSPCTPDLKMLESNGGDGSFFDAWGGVSTIGLGLSVLWTEGEKRGVDLATMAEWTSYKTAEQVGLLGQKGALAAGYDADICIFDPEATFKVCCIPVPHTCQCTKYANGMIGYRRRDSLQKQGDAIRRKDVEGTCFGDVVEGTPDLLACGRVRQEGSPG